MTPTVSPLNSGTSEHSSTYYYHYYTKNEKEKKVDFHGTYALSIGKQITVQVPPPTGHGWLKTYVFKVRKNKTFLPAYYKC